MTSLIDWLYTSDIVDGPVISPSKQGALIIFPRMIDRWNIASVIVSEWASYRVVVVTDHPTEFTDSVMAISVKCDETASSNSPDRIALSRHWTDRDLLPFTLLNYSDFDGINRALKNTEVDLILFDDTRMLATISPALNFTSIQPKILVLTSWGDSYTHLDRVTTALPDLRLLVLTVISDTADVEWKIIKSPLSTRQLPYYNKIRSQESLSTATPLLYPKSRMITLYQYPDIITNNISIHSVVCEPSVTELPDVLGTSGTWITVSSLNNLQSDGPKLLNVLDGVVSNWPSKQVVLTRFGYRYGVDLITSFLQLLTLTKQNPYNLPEIYHMSCTDNRETILNTLHKFNESESGVLVSNIVPLIPLKGISNIHVVDSYSFHTIKAFLDKCLKRFLTNGTTNLVIYNYVATIPGDLSSDEALVDRLMSEVSDANRIYSGMIQAANKIVIKPCEGLFVI